MGLSCFPLPGGRGRVRQHRGEGERQQGQISLFPRHSWGFLLDSLKSYNICMNLRQLFSFLLLNGLLWCVCALGYFHTSGFFAGALGISFTLTFILGHLFLMAWACGLLCLPGRLFGPRGLQIACTVWGGIFSLFLALDLLVYSQYRFHISPAMLELFFGPAGREIFAFSTVMWICVWTGVLLLFALEFALTLLAKRWALTPKTIAGMLAGWLLIFLTYNGLYAWGKFNMVPSIMSQRGVLPLAAPFSLNRRLRKLGFEPKKDPYAQPAAGTLNYPTAPLVCNAPQHPKNVLILLVESWRADSFNPQVMPQLSTWAQHKPMSHFTAHLSGGNATEAGVFSLFYSLPYAYWNDITSRQLPPALLTRAWETGYEPAIFSSGKLNSPTFHQNVFAGVPNLRLESQGTRKWQRDVNAVEDFEQFLQYRSPNKPFFGFIFLDAPHGSDYPAEDQLFTPAQEMNYLLLSKNTDPTPYMNQYKNSVHFTDRMIGRILTDLQTRGLLQNTIVIITGDHGQEINDTRRNFWGHNGNFTDYQTHVPLLVWDTDHFAGQAAYRTTHYDVAPTLLQHVFGCTGPVQNYAIGQNLFDPAPRPFALISSYTKKAIRTGDQLTVLDQYGGIEQYDAQFNTSAGAAPSALKKALQTFAQFYN